MKNGKRTRFGNYLKSLQNLHDVSTKEIACCNHVTEVFISALVVGKKSIPEYFYDKTATLFETYGANYLEIRENLKKLAFESKLKYEFTPQNEEERKLILDLDKKIKELRTIKF